MWPSLYCCSPRSGLARSWRQSKTRHFWKLAARSPVETSVEPFMKMHLRIFHWRLVRAGVVEALLVEGAPPAVQAQADLVVLDRGLDVCGLLRVDELALEERDLLGVVKLDHVGGASGRAWDQVRDDEHVRIPLEHEPRIVGHPQRAMLHRAAIEILEAGFVPALVGRRAGPGE